MKPRRSACILSDERDVMVRQGGMRPVADGYFVRGVGMSASSTLSFWARCDR